jgi:hypothetical protein
VPRPQRAVRRRAPDHGRTHRSQAGRGLPDRRPPGHGGGRPGC